MNHLQASRLLQMLALAAALVLPAWKTEAADKNGYTMIGVGRLSCGQWSADKSANLGAHAVEQAWVGGFITAYNRYEWKGSDATSETDGQGIMAWVDNYCAANPTKNIAAASEALMMFLSVGPHLNDK